MACVSSEQDIGATLDDHDYCVQVPAERGGHVHTRDRVRRRHASTATTPVITHVLGSGTAARKWLAYPAPNSLKCSRTFSSDGSVMPLVLRSDPSRNERARVNVPLCVLNARSIST